MRGSGPGPSSAVGAAVQRALLTGGVAIAVFTALATFATRGNHSAGFSQAVEIDAVLIEQGLLRSGASRPTCSPLYRFEWDGTTKTARPPTRQAASCVGEGRTVRILVDAANPSRVADPAAEKELRSASLSAVGLAGSMILLGAIIAWRRRNSSL